jgi:hypothetical protein
MKRVIYKYVLDPDKIDEVQEIKYPGFGLARAFAAQGNQLVLWIEHDLEGEGEISSWFLRFTGQPFEPTDEEFYFGTAQLGWLVYHLYGVMDLSEEGDE